VFAVLEPDAGQDGSQQEKGRHQNQGAPAGWFDGLPIGLWGVGGGRFHYAAFLVFLIIGHYSSLSILENSEPGGQVVPGR
jgi:hypothetical protein